MEEMLEDPITYLIVALGIIACIAVWGFNVAMEPTDYSELPISVLTDDTGKFICKLDGSLSRSDFDTYDEALRYCEEWRKLMVESQERRNRNWKEVTK